MFETAVLSYGAPTKRVWATLAGFTGQLILIGVALLAPLMWPQMIPRVAWVMTIASPGPPPPPPPPPGEHTATAASRRPRTQMDGRQLLLPRVIPIRPLQIDDPPLEAGGSGPGVVGGVEGGEMGGVPGGILRDIMQAGRPVPIRPPDPIKDRASVVTAPVDKPMRISQLQPATPIRKVDPIYPPLARQARISGTVELVGVLGIDGRIHELRVVRGHALLIDAAMVAVKQWIFAPTILNGQPVEVQAPIQVTFILNH